MAVGKKFSVDFEQATEINGNTQILVQSEGQPVEKASVEQLGVALMDEEIIPNPDGTYSKMTVGFAENVVGDGSATEEEFSFRPTAGVNRNTLNDGAARIHSIKGRSVVANQQIELPTHTAERDGVTFTPNLENGTIRATGIPTSATAYGLKAIKWKDGEKFFVFGGMEGGGPYPKGNMILDQGSQNDQGNGSIWTPLSYWPENGLVPILRIGTDYIGKEIDFTFKPIIVNLTQEFGAGNEPLTVEEYYQRKPILLNEGEYNEGKLVNLVPQAIKTTGFNQFNGTYAKVLGGVQYYLGGNYTSIGFATEEGGVIEAITTPTSSEVAGGSAPADRLYTPSQNGYIYANGDNICISLYWPTEYGNLYGSYKPYKPFVRDLGDIIAKYFTGGVMRSAGSAHDEIRFNSTEQRWEAVQRVDVRPYAAGDESNTAVTTDGTYTNYALATPDVKVMDGIPNFDFDVSDYGSGTYLVKISDFTFKFIKQ